MCNFILFYSGNSLIARSDGEKKNKERKEERTLKKVFV